MAELQYDGDLIIEVRYLEDAYDTLAKCADVAKRLRDLIVASE